MIETIQEETRLSSVLTYRLIAQTPYIHFQHSQDGATVRATEVKPKLDKFILQIAEKNGTDHDVIKSWFVRDTEKTRENSEEDRQENESEAVDEAGTDKEVPKEKNRALDYKLHICAIGGNKRDLSIRDFKFYFADMDANTNKKSFVYKDVDLTIICKHRKLAELIDRYIKSFFILHNFGSRQSKGFGGFLVDRTDSDEINRVLRAGGDPYIRFCARQNPAGRFPLELVAFQQAKTVYSAMKGGINDTGFNPISSGGEVVPANGSYASPQAYVKGYIQRKYLPQTVGSDKAFVKKYVVKIPDSRVISSNEMRSEVLRRRFAEDKENYRSFLFVRALLGLADHYLYRDDIRCACRSVRQNQRTGRWIADYDIRQAHVLNFANVAVDSDGRCTVSLDEIQKNSGIKRFKSPVTIKLFAIDETTYDVRFIFHDSYQAILSKTFIFIDDDQKAQYKEAVDEKDYDRASQILQGSPCIRTPDSFDRKSFINGFVEYFNSQDVQARLSTCRPENRARIKLFIG